MKEKRNIILIIVLVCLVASSAFLLYRSFSAQPLAIIPVTVSNDDVRTRSEVESLKVKIHKAVGNVDTGGSLESLSQSPQYQQLTNEGIKEVEIGSYGRTNPFLPVQ